MWIDSRMGKAHCESRTAATTERSYSHCHKSMNTSLSESNESAGDHNARPQKDRDRTGNLRRYRRRTLIPGGLAPMDRKVERGHVDAGQNNQQELDAERSIETVLSF